MKPNKILQKSIVFEKKILPLQSIWRFRSSVGLEQQPSKLWVLGSNPNGITKIMEKEVCQEFLVSLFSV